MKINVRDETFELSSDRALYWPKHEMLVIADLHLGKSETFQKHGLWLPSQAHIEDIRRISALTDLYKVSHILFLGDLVHTAMGMSPELIDFFGHWVNHFEGDVTVAIGNHDQKIAKNWPVEWSKIQMVDEIEVDGFVLQHEPPTAKQLTSGDFFWTGHIHPVVVLEQGPDRLRLPCFVVEKNEGMLPAFSSVAGGHNMKISGSRRIYAVGAGRIFELGRPLRGEQGLR